jgi:hypothetical protein
METKQLIKLARLSNSLKLSRSSVEKQMELLNSVMEGYGVEVIRGQTWDRYFTDACGVYVNMGDTYVVTILYDVCRQRFVVTTWGDWVEEHQKNYGIQ